MASIGNNSFNVVQDSYESSVSQQQSFRNELNIFFNNLSIPITPARTALMFAMQEVSDSSDRSIEISKLATQVLSTWSESAQNDESIVKTLRDVENRSLETVWGKIVKQLDSNEAFPTDADEIRTWLQNPENIEILQEVEELYLDNCDLLLVPTEISHLSSLKKLDLSDNKLQSVQLENLINLEVLYLCENKIKNLNLNNLPKLTILNLMENEIDDQTLVSIRDTINFDYINLDNNNLSDINLLQSILNESEKINEISFKENRIEGVRILLKGHTEPQVDRQSGSSLSLPRRDTDKSLDTSDSTFSILERKYPNIGEISQRLGQGDDECDPRIVFHNHKQSTLNQLPSSSSDFNREYTPTCDVLGADLSSTDSYESDRDNSDALSEAPYSDRIERNFELENGFRVFDLGNRSRVIAETTYPDSDSSGPLFDSPLSQEEDNSSAETESLEFSSGSDSDSSGPLYDPPYSQ